MNTSQQKRTTWIVIGAALAVVIIGIVYLRLTADPSAVSAVNTGNSELRVSLADAKAAFDNESALFVDVRSTGEYNTSHIPGALLIPLENITGSEPAVEKDTLIYTYCT